MLNKVNLQQFKNAKTELFAEQMAEHISTHFVKLVASIPSNKESLLKFIQQVILSAQQQEIDSGRYLTLYILISLLLGLDWDKDPQYVHVNAILSDMYSSTDVRFSVSLHHAIEERKNLLRVVSDIREVILEISLSSAEIIHPMYSYYVRLLLDKRNFINPVNKDLLIQTYEGLFDRNFPVEERPHDGDEWWDNILSDDWKSEKENKMINSQKKLIYIGLSLCYGAFFLINENYTLIKKEISLSDESFRDLANFFRGGAEILAGVENGI